MATRNRGSDNTTPALRAARSAARLRGVQVGVFESARYPNGEYVAAVAAKNEFGEQRVPARPFMTRGVKASATEVQRLLKRELDPRTLEIDERLLERIGLLTAGRIQQEITDLRQPPNSPATIAAKGSSNPLIDTGKLRQSISYEVVS